MLGRGKTVVLAFWDSADKSAADVVKTLNAVANEHPDVAVIAVHTTDGDKDALQELVEKENIAFCVALAVVEEAVERVIAGE